MAKATHYTVKTAFDRQGNAYLVGDIVDAKDPILETHGQYFTEMRLHAPASKTPQQLPAVEQATASPGEKRGAKA